MRFPRWIGTAVAVLVLGLVAAAIVARFAKGTQPHSPGDLS